MFELIELTSAKEMYRREVLTSLPESGDDWNAVQRFRIASYFAMDGDRQARDMMYKSFNPGPRMAEQTCIDFVRMDGLKGFLFAAQKMAGLIISRSGKVDGDYLLSEAIEIFGERPTLDALTEFAKGNPQSTSRGLQDIGRGEARRSDTHTRSGSCLTPT